MRSSAYLQYDESNGALYGWVAFVIYETEVKQIDLYIFPTLGHAQVFYKHLLDGEWEQEAPGAKWFGHLKQRNNPYNAQGGARAVKIELKQLLYMGDDQCKSDSDVKIGEKK